MAHIFAGDPQRLDPEVVTALSTLPDDFWIFAEFTIARHIGYFVCRAADVDASCGSTFLAVELKRSAQCLRGDVDGPWDRLDESGQ